MFPASRLYLHAETERRRRRHLHESVLQEAIRETALKEGIAMIYTHVLNRGGRGVRSPLGGVP